MNKDQILEYCQEYISDVHLVDSDHVEISEASVYLEDASAQTIIFYSLDNNEKSIETFLKKVSVTKTPLIVVNNNLIFKYKDQFPVKNIIAVKPQYFLEAQKKILDELYPIEELLKTKKLVGITGSNGKTTTSKLAVQISESLGKSAFSIGTLGVEDSQKKLYDLKGMTTPSYVEMRKIFGTFLKDYDVCFMEVSSHALDLQRVYGFKFDQTAWMSFGQDHLDFHKNMEQYFLAKLKIFDHLKNNDSYVFVPSAEKDLQNKLAKMPQVKVSTPVEKYAFSHLPFFFIPQFNKNNLEVALDLNFHLWGSVTRNEFKVDFSHINYPKGRYETHHFLNKTVIIDSAHTPDALENICKAIYEAYPQKEFFILFGCGGDRDFAKRPLMAQVAAKYTHKVFLTSDNSRNEDPEKILNETFVGFSPDERPKVVQTVDRFSAAQKAFSELPEGGVLLMAGKGHEEYQLMNGIKYPYSDLEAIIKVVNEHKAKK